VDRRFLADSLRAMLEHGRSLDRRSQGDYWHAITTRLLKQIDSFQGDAFYSSELSYASAFSGSPYNSMADLGRELQAAPWSLAAKKIENCLARVAGRSRWLDFTWRLVLPRVRTMHHAQQAEANYAALVHYGFALFRREIESLDVRSPSCYGPDLVSVERRELAFTTIRNLNILLRIKDVVGPSRDTVVEIGAGAGELARIMLASGFCRRCIIVDIPPALAFSQCLLASAFPEARLGFFDPRRGPIADDGTLVHFLTPDQIGDIPAFDLGVNVASFGEMSRAIVSGYIGALKAAGFKDFVSINQRLKKTGNTAAIGESEYAAWFGPEYRIAARSGWHSDRPVLTLPTDTPGQPGYQLLHFTRNQPE
jgi:putative sugar O-methyltransferase